MPEAPLQPEDWWQDFFESPDCLPLSFFPAPAETATEVEGLRRLLELGPGTVLADVCCGEGRQSVPLAQGGCRVVGLDLSGYLLARGRARAAELGVPVSFLRADARRLPLRSGAFAVVTNLFNSFGYCETDEENEAVIGEAARVLAPGGQFLLETRNPQFQILFAPVRQHVRGARGRALLMACRYDLARHRLEITWARESHPEEVLYRGGIRLYQLEELRAMGARAGLEEVGVYGEFSGAPYDGHERLLIMHWRKP